MELVKTVLRLSLSEAFNPWLEMRNMIRELGEAPKAEVQGPAVIIDLKQKKQRLALNIRAIELEQECVSSIGESSAVALDKMAQANSVSKFSEVRGVWHQAIYIEPYALPFHELVIALKKRFLRASELVDTSTDVGVILDKAEGDVVKHYEIGPMAKEQLLSMYLIWPRDGLPDSFVYLLLRYEQNEAFSFDREYLGGFLAAANEWEVSQARWVSNYLREKGD